LPNTENFISLPSAPPAIHISRASLSYDGSFLFKDLELQLPGGHCSVLLGPSGVGKSSLLRLIAGLEAVEGGGSVEFTSNGCSPSDCATTAPAYMAQRDLLLPWLDALGNVTLGQRLRRQPPDLARAQNLLARVGLENYVYARSATLSGGMRQRVAIARTLMEERPVVLMDEPFSALDAITRLSLQDLAAELLRGRTILLVTHDPMEALRLGERIFVMSGRPARLSESPTPGGKIPRDPADKEFLAYHAELLNRLGAAEAGL